MRLMVPAALEERRALGGAWGPWLDALPRTFRDVVEEWDLTPEGEPMHGFCSVVVPVGTPEHVPAVLKLGITDDESEHEHLALRAWGGNGAVRLLAADPRRGALLLERLHQRTLEEVGDLEACEVIAGLYSRLHVPALPQLRPVTSYVARWLDALAAMPVDGPIPRRLVDQTLHVGRSLVEDPGSTGVIVHGDLHFANVLAADREPWLVIDPKAMSGDPHYEPAPVLWNRWDEMVGSGDLRAALRRRFHTLVDAAGLDEARARDWVIVRMVLNAHWAVEDAERAARALSTEESKWITRCVAIVKAVQD